MRAPASASGLRRDLVAARTRAVLNRGNRRNPDVMLVEGDRGLVVVKDFAPRGWWVRHLFGPWIHAREVRAYRALEGHPAVPRFLGRIDRLAFVVEYRPGRRLGGRLAASLPPEFLPALERAIADMHARGVAHLDLRHRSNILVGEDGRPILIDFASAVCLRPEGWAARWLLPLLVWLDWRAFAKWQRKLGLHSTAGATGGDSDGRRGASRPT